MVLSKEMGFDKLVQNLPGTKTPETRHCKGVYRSMLLIFGILIMYWLFLAMNCGLANASNCDNINRVLFDTKIIGNFGGWNLTHLIFYYFVGLLFPDCILIAMVIGVIWEIFEEILGSINLPGMVNTTGVSGLQYGDRWVKGNLNDILCNFIGFVAGMLTTKYLLNGKPPKVPWISG